MLVSSLKVGRLVTPVKRPALVRVPVTVIPVALSLICACSSPPGPDRVFVSDEQANVVHVLDGASGRIEGSLQTGPRPRGMAISPDGKTLYVAASNADRIEVWDTQSLRHLRNLAPGNDPERIVLSPDGRTIYAANEDDSTVAAIDSGSGRVVASAPTGPEPEGIGVAPDDRTLLVTSEAASVLHVFALPRLSSLANLPIGARSRDVMFLNGGHAWISSEQRATITILALEPLRRVGAIDLVGQLPDVDTVQAVEMERTRDGKRVFVALGRGNAVAEIDPRTRTVRRIFPAGQRVWGIALSPDERRLYAVAGLSGTLTIIDLRTNRLARTVTLGGRPWTVVAVSR